MHEQRNKLAIAVVEQQKRKQSNCLINLRFFSTGIDDAPSNGDHHFREVMGHRDKYMRHSSCDTWGGLKAE